MPRSLPRKAFTLIEMLVVIGVLLVLAAISALALGRLDNGTRATKVALQNCQSMLAEYEAAGGGNIPMDNTQTGAPGGLISNDNNGNGLADKWDLSIGVISQTNQVMTQLLASPKCAEIYAKIPQKLHMPTPPGGYNSTNAYATGVADAWHNPIIYVTPGGLSGVNLGANSSGGFSQSGVVVKSRDGRPFFASAGPDGDFTTGDDNVYSFEK